MTVLGIDVSDRRQSAHVVIGITGPIAAGKSTVANMLQEHGAELIDADRVYHALLRPSSTVWRAIVDRFGTGVLGVNAEIDRGALGRIVFSDPSLLAELESLTHPAVVAEVRRLLAHASAKVVVIEAVKLVQSGLGRDVDSVWLITADSETRARRIMSRNQIDHDMALDRVNASAVALPMGFEPDVMIDTTDGIVETRRAVESAWHATVHLAA